MTCPVPHGDVARVPHAACRISQAEKSGARARKRETRDESRRVLAGVRPGDVLALIRGRKTRLCVVGAKATVRLGPRRGLRHCRGRHLAGAGSGGRARRYRRRRTHVDPWRLRPATHEGTYPYRWRAAFGSAKGLLPSARTGLAECSDPIGAAPRGDARSIRSTAARTARNTRGRAPSGRAWRREIDRLRHPSTPRRVRSRPTLTVSARSLSASVFWTATG